MKTGALAGSCPEGALAARKIPAERNVTIQPVFEEDL